MVGEEEADGMGMVDEAEEVRTGTGVEGDIMGNMVVWICMIFPKAVLIWDRILEYAYCSDSKRCETREGITCTAPFRLTSDDLKGLACHVNPRSKGTSHCA